MGINVKLDRYTLIAKLEAKRNEFLKEQAEYNGSLKTLEEANKNALKNFKKLLAKAKPSGVKIVNHRYIGGKVIPAIQVTVEIPSYPTVKGNSRIKELAEVDTIIRLLKMTDQKYINTSSYRAVSEYL